MSDTTDKVPNVETAPVSVTGSVETDPLKGLVAGRIVYYVDEHGKEHPAMVLHVGESGAIHLNYFALGWRLGIVYSQRDVAYSEEAKSHTWHWMYPGQQIRGNAK